MPSLALIFHLIDIADGKGVTSVSYAATALAIGWCDYLEEHARRIYGMATDAVKQSVVKLSKKILEGELTSPFSLRDVYRKQWAFLDEKEIVQKACNELVELGWLRAELSAQEFGRPNLPKFAINPHVKKQSEST